jgi:hypothetical protein
MRGNQSSAHDFYVLGLVEFRFQQLQKRIFAHLELLELELRRANLPVKVDGVVQEQDLLLGEVVCVMLNAVYRDNLRAFFFAHFVFL